MHSLSRSLMFLCLFSGMVHAAPASDETAVAAAVDRMTQAMLHKNIAELEALTADTVSYGHSSGKVQDKQAFIDDIKTGRSGFNTLKMLNQTIIMNGEVALVRNHFSAEAVNSGKVVPTEIENFQVWQQRSGQWQLIGRQAFKF